MREEVEKRKWCARGIVCWEEEEGLQGGGFKVMCDERNKVTRLQWWWKWFLRATVT